MISRMALIILLAVSVMVAFAGCGDSTDSAAPSSSGESGDSGNSAVDAGGDGVSSGEVRRIGPGPLYGEDTPDPAYVQAGSKAAMRKAIEHLRQTQNDDGGWPAPNSKESNLGVTSVAVTGLASAGVPADDPMMARAVEYMLGFVRDDGSIHDGTSMNYTTSLCSAALAMIDAAKYEAVIRKAGENIGQKQWGGDPESADFGGSGYGGKHDRPDMSNTSFAIQARHAMQEAGIDIEDEFMKNAAVFVSRNQGGEASKGYWVGAADGGFIYTTHNGGESKAGKFLMASGGEGLKAYGSMTYAGFLSLIYAGLDRQDQRVQAALDWMGKNWTLEENPQMGLQGYYYYLMLVGKALRAYGEPQLTDDKGTAIQWRKALTAKLIELQQADGSWINEADRWYEGAKPVVTGYGLIAMSAAMQELPGDK